MTKILLIVGGKSTGLEIREVVDLYYKDSFDYVYNVIGNEDEVCAFSYLRDNEMNSLFNDPTNDLYYIVSMSNHKLRIMFDEFFLRNNVKPFNVIHPKAEISPSASVGKNVYIACGVVISSFAKIEDNVMLNFGVLVGHDSVVRNNCVLLPGCKIGGGAIINNNCLIGSNSFIKQGVNIGKNTFVDAMCYVEKSIGENKMYKSKIENKLFKNIFL